MVKIERLEKWLNRYDENGYINGSILIAAKGKIVLNKGFGLANFEHAIPNSATTKFRIGSLTKAFTAMAIFQLHEQGKLCIDDPIGKYLPHYPNGEKITIYHCLTNTSGIPNYTSFPDFWPKTMRLRMTLDQLIETFKHLDLHFEPGTRFAYSNSGYTLLTAIIEEVSDMTYGDDIKVKICRPLGMKNSGCDDGVTVIPELASGYSVWEQPIHAEYADLSFPLGAYGLYSTTEDLYIWDRALTSSRLINRSLTERMFTPYQNSYACGWVISEKLGRKCVHHFGDISGYCSHFLRFVEEDVTIIFLSNMNVTPVTHLTLEMAKIIFDEDVSLPLSIARSIQIVNKERFIGKYFFENEEEKTLEITLKNNHLYLTVPKMYGVLYKFKLVPVLQDETKTIFVTEMIHEQIIFYHDISGEIKAIEYIDYYDKKINLVQC